MEKGKKQKKNAAPALAPPQKKIKKAQRKKGKAPLSTPSSSAPARVPPSKTPALPEPSVPDKKPLANENGAAKGETSAGKKEGAQQRVAGYIFFCNGKTKAECYQHRVFGLPKGKLEDVEKIRKGTKLFLFDYDLKLLYGVYMAVSNGALNLEAGAFNGNFPAQVKFKVFKDSYPLPETSLRLAIKDNYNSKGRFKPELGFEQVKNLLSLYQPINNNSRQSTIPRVEERRAILPPEERSRIGGAYGSARADPRYAPPIAPHIQNDPYPYASAAHVTRGPPLVEPMYVPASRLPHGTGSYYSAADGLPPPNDAYQTAATSVQADSRGYYPRSSVLLERYRAIPQIMLPENEMAPRMELANQYYSTGRAVASAAELPPQHSSWAPRYESQDLMYADDLHRSISSRANAPNLPVSSLYSFAGAAPAYR